MTPRFGLHRGNSRCIGMMLLLMLAACRTVGPVADVTQHHRCLSAECTLGMDLALQAARQSAQRASHSRNDREMAVESLNCATQAYVALRSHAPELTSSAAALATQCTDQFLSRILAQQPDGWSEGHANVGDTELTVQFQELSPYLQPPLQLKLAREVSMAAYGGVRHASPGFGVPLAILTPRCRDAPLCRLQPPEGIFRNATAWIEPNPSPDAPPRLVIADALKVKAMRVDGQRYPLAIDTSAAWARGARTSKLKRLAIWGLLGGHEIGDRSGLYLLEDYDPNKRPLVMIHGLGSSPLMWAKLSNAVWGDAELRDRFQVWHVVLHTNAPLLVMRRRVKTYLDEAWRVLDPERDDPARSGVVVVGHSLGGVLARMLCVDSGDTLWSAAFTVPPGAVHADPSDLQIMEETFFFKAYPGVTRAIFMAAPHRGSPSATHWFGRLARLIVGRRAPEIRALRRVTRADPDAVRPELRRSYEHGWINSITTLRISQPVRAAGEALIPVAGVRYHTIAGSLPRRKPETDGVVPLSSAVLAGAESTLIISSGHDVYDQPEAIDEVLRILRASQDDKRQLMPGHGEAPGTL